MGRSRGSKDARPGDAKPASSSSASSSEFEFTVQLSPASKQRSAAQLCPADELFYKGQLLPLQLSPRISMVRTLLLSSASTSSASASDSTSTSRDSNGSTSSSFSADLLLPDSAASSSRPSSATDDDRHHLNHHSFAAAAAGNINSSKRSGKQYLSSFATRFSSVFHRGAGVGGGGPAKKQQQPSKSLAKEVIKKYAKKVKPLYEKLSQQIPTNKNQQQHNNSSGGFGSSTNQQQGFKKPAFTFSIRKNNNKRGDDDHAMASGAATSAAEAEVVGASKYAHSNSFSGNLRFPRQKRCAASCPSSMRSSPSHSGLLTFGGAGGAGFPDVPAAAAAAVAAAGGVVGGVRAPVSLSTASSMEELQSAIEGAIAHCKNTMVGSTLPGFPRKPDGDEICAF
ncbi:hypothetical protein QOZ80_5AG0374570 [Eleusine coracana subsp. coracana]|nr:hypothetical protein QOZ80_5AG0374570 [Eleusine coracana subsp. coracana]